MGDVLSLLRGAGGKAVSGTALARRLGVSRAAVHKQVQKLRSEGHSVVGVNRLGYRLETEPDGFDRALFSPGWGRPFLHFPSIPSTQEEAKARAAAGEKEGALFVADRQTAGRGRLGRRWESPAGGLWYSLILRPTLPPSSAAGLALAAALDWARLLRARGVPAAVKWPNDVWVEEKKVAGVLTEMSTEPDRVHWMVLGVGVNVNNAPPKGALFRSASLRSLTGRSWPRAALLADWMARFRETCARYVEGGFSSMREEYGRHALLNGREVSVETSDGLLSGTAAGVDDSGRLLIRGPSGMVVVAAGDVRIRPLK